MIDKLVSTPVVTIDGPSGSGKGTIAALLAKKLNWNLLDSGVLYRLVALHALNQDVDLDDESGLISLCDHLDVQFKPDKPSGVSSIIVQGVLIGDELRSEDVGAKASKIAVLSGVRLALLQKQRNFAVAPGLVADGRDMGTVVFPEADLKFFLTASAEERAKRRMEQLHSGGVDSIFSSLLADIVARDKRDSSRSVAPLLPARDAIVIDSSALTISDVIDRVVSEVSLKRLV